MNRFVKPFENNKFPPFNKKGWFKYEGDNNNYLFKNTKIKYHCMDKRLYIAN